MSIYDLPKFELPKLKVFKKISWPKIFKNQAFWLIISIILISSIFGFLAGAISGSYFYSEVKGFLEKLSIEMPEIQKVIEKETIIEKEYTPQTTQEQATIKVVDEVSPAVVSIIVTKDLSVIYVMPFELQIPSQKEVEKREVGGGTGFIVSEDGMILTNKHVVLDKEADYTVLTNDGRKFPAEVLARDPVQDLAILKIEGSNFPVVRLGDSDKLQIGQTVVAIGNALGEFRNTISVGVISGLGRTITASGGGLVETLEDVIQTDAAINKGNSGGPLLNLKGEVIGINTAMALGAQSIGFAIPVNKAKKDIEQVKTTGKIVYPFLGIRYILITEAIQQENSLPVNYGAWIIRGEEPEETAIFPGSAAEKAGLKEGDMVLEFNGERITTDNSLVKIIMRYNPGDKVILKILRNSKEKIIQVALDERSEE